MSQFVCEECGYNTFQKCGKCRPVNVVTGKPKNTTDGADPWPETILAEAARIVGGDRHESYGAPLDSHSCTAELVTTWLRRRYGEAVPALTAEDICMFNILQKCAREANTPKRDNLVDIAGYAANVQMCVDARKTL